LKAWGKENAPGVGYRSLCKRYKDWTDAGQPEPPPPLPPHINRSLSAPSCHTPGLGDARGGHNRKWTREQEELFVETMAKPVIEREGINNGGMRDLAKEFVEVIYKSTSREGPKTRSGPAVIIPSAPTGREWLTRVKREHGLFSGLCSFTRQIHVTDRDSVIARAFINQVRVGMYKYGAGGVIAMDETFWNLHPKIRL